MKARLALALLLFCSAAAFAQLPNGVFEGYNGEWKHVTEQLIALAEATPADKFNFRPEPGVRSTSEVFMHIAAANFWMLRPLGVERPADLPKDPEKGVTSKAEVIAWLKRSFEAVEKARAAETPQTLQRKVKVMDRDFPADGVYLRLIIHDNEHMGQLIAYARMSGVTPPWAQ